MNSYPCVWCGKECGEHAEATEEGRLCPGTTSSYYTVAPDFDARASAKKRQECIEYLRSLPAGGIAEVLAEAKIAQWGVHTTTLFSLDNARLGYVVEDEITSGWSATWKVNPFFAGTWLHSGHPTESDARSWVEAKAKEAGWTILGWLR